MAEVRFEAVTKRFGSVTAVDNLRLTITDGEFVVLVGPSGSGKTTALRLLAGLEAASEGHIWIGSRKVDDIGPRDRDIAMVFQDYALYPQMTVWKNLAFGLRMRKVPRQEIERRVRGAVESLHLEDLLNRRPGELSGGQRQRVALGRALVRQPSVFLMDEPLSNLDANLRAEMRSEIRRLQEEIGTTTVYVTHDQVEAMTMGDRIAVMRDARLLQVADLKDIYERPANTFVASFLGSPGMSLGRWELTERDSELRLRREGCDLSIDGRRANGLPLGEVIVGVRPEDAHLWRAERGMVGPVRGQVRVVEVLGREVFVTVECAAGRYVIEAGRTAALPRSGDNLDFGFDADRLCVFDCESGNAIGRL